MPDLYLPFKEMEHLSDIEAKDKKQAIAERKKRREQRKVNRANES